MIPPKTQAGPSAVLPLVFATGVSLLATDLYLPSVPLLPDLLGGTIAQAQFTLAVFFVTFAACQLLHGAFAEKYGNLRVLLFASSVFVVATCLGALATGMDQLIVARALQGAGAAAATAIVPAVIRQAYDVNTGIRMLSWLGICESVIPAFGPLLGALVLHLLGWRANFWGLALIAIAAALLLIRNREVYEAIEPVGRQTRSVWLSLVPNYAAILGSRAFLAYALGYSTAYGALMTFVGAAPYLLQTVYGHGPGSFGIMQIVMVAVFMAGSLLAGRAVETLGLHKTIAIGLLLLLVSAVLLLMTSVDAVPDTAVTMTLAMLPSQFGIGLRFGASMSAAIGSHPDRQAGAAAMTSFLCFLFAALGNGAVALFLDHGLLAVALTCLAFAAVSTGAFLMLPPLRPFGRLPTPARKF